MTDRGKREGRQVEGEKWRGREGKVGRRIGEG